MELNIREALRYLGVRGADEALLRRIFEEAEKS